MIAIIVLQFVLKLGFNIYTNRATLGKGKSIIWEKQGLDDKDEEVRITSIVETATLATSANSFIDAAVQASDFTATAAGQGT